MRTRADVSSSGWPDTSYSRIYRLTLNNLAGWAAPPTLSKSLSEISTNFDLIAQHTAVAPHPLFGEIMENAAVTDKGRYLDAYKVAANDVELGAARILVALNAQKQVVGSIILIWVTGGVGKLERYMPWIRLGGQGGGRIG